MVINLIASRIRIYYSFWPACYFLLKRLGFLSSPEITVYICNTIVKSFEWKMSVKFTSLTAGKDCVGDWDKILIFLLTSALLGNELAGALLLPGTEEQSKLICKQPLLLVPCPAWSRRTWVISLSLVLLNPPAQLLWVIHLKSRSGGWEDVGTGAEEQGCAPSCDCSCWCQGSLLAERAVELPRNMQVLESIVALATKYTGN